MLSMYLLEIFSFHLVFSVAESQIWTDQFSPNLFGIMNITKFPSYFVPLDRKNPELKSTAILFQSAKMGQKLTFALTLIISAPEADEKLFLPAYEMALKIEFISRYTIYRQSKPILGRIVTFNARKLQNQLNCNVSFAGNFDQVALVNENFILNWFQLHSSWSRETLQVTMDSGPGFFSREVLLHVIIPVSCHLKFEFASLSVWKAVEIVPVKWDDDVGGVNYRENEEEIIAIAYKNSNLAKEFNSAMNFAMTKRDGHQPSPIFAYTTSQIALNLQSKSSYKCSDQCFPFFFEAGERFGLSFNEYGCRKRDKRFRYFEWWLCRYSNVPSEDVAIRDLYYRDQCSLACPSPKRKLRAVADSVDIGIDCSNVEPNHGGFILSKYRTPSGKIADKLVPSKVWFFYDGSKPNPWLDESQATHKPFPPVIRFGTMDGFLSYRCFSITEKRSLYEVVLGPDELGYILKRDTDIFGSERIRTEGKDVVFLKADGRPKQILVRFKFANPIERHRDWPEIDLRLTDRTNKLPVELTMNMLGSVDTRVGADKQTVEMQVNFDSNAAKKLIIMGGEIFDIYVHVVAIFKDTLTYNLPIELFITSFHLTVHGDAM